MPRWQWGMGVTLTDPMSGQALLPLTTDYSFCGFSIQAEQKWVEAASRPSVLSYRAFYSTLGTEAAHS